jgi:hypothetical protein
MECRPESQSLKRLSQVRERRGNRRLLPVAKCDPLEKSYEELARREADEEALGLCTRLSFLKEL